MALFYGSVDNIPSFIRASSPTGLVNKIKALQRKRSIEIKFFAIYHDGKEHIAWYYDNIENIVSDKLKGVNNVNSQEPKEST